MRDAKLRRAEVRGHDMTARRQATRGEIAWTPPIAWDSTNWNCPASGYHSNVRIAVSKSRHDIYGLAASVLFQAFPRGL